VSQSQHPSIRAQTIKKIATMATMIMTTAISVLQAIGSPRQTAAAPPTGHSDLVRTHYALPMKVLGLICMAAGFLIAILAGVVLWPGLDEYEWPGWVPFLTLIGGSVLMLIGIRLWTGERPSSLD
jgi:peptidoglycan/LPS O-acetylase OafA/YrhL